MSYDQSKKTPKENRKPKIKAETVSITETEEDEDDTGEGHFRGSSVKFGSGPPSFHRVLSTSALRIPRQRQSFWTRWVRERERICFFVLTAAQAHLRTIVRE